VSTEIHVGDLYLNVPDQVDPPPGEGVTDDRVRLTADDRPNTDTLPALVDPARDHTDAELSRRRADVDEKHRRVAEFLDRHGYDSLVLTRADSLAWFTSGGELRKHLGSDEGSVCLFLNRQTRAVVADNVQSCRVFEEEVAGLGFHLKERPWSEPPANTIAALARGKKVACDRAAFGLPDESERLLPARLSLTRLERQRLRELGRTVSLAVEATCRNFEPGETEADLAGHLAHRLLREGVAPVDLRVASDDRLERYRSPTFKAAPIFRRAIISATGRRHGLHASVTRIVSIGPVDPAFRQAHAIAAMVDATYIYFSRAGEPLSEVFRRARRIFEKNNFPHEWALDYQGFATGYSPHELLLLPDRDWRLPPDMALCWSPSVRSARSEDTTVVDARGGFEVVTEAQRWPKLEVIVKGFPLPRPGILER
jgi:Xaa-Pro aminopeptidase